MYNFIKIDNILPQTVTVFYPNIIDCDNITVIFFKNTKILNKICYSSFKKNSGDKSWCVPDTPTIL